MRFSPEQIAELSEIIDRFALVFIAEQIGPDFLSQREKDLLRKHGIDVNTLPQTYVFEHAFKFGILSEALGNKQAKGMNYEQFKEFVNSGKFIPLTDIEQGALDYVKMRGASDLRGLGNKISKDFSHTLIEGDRRARLQYEKLIKKETEQAIINRKSATYLASELGHKTGDWARDFDRIADYVMHEAYDNGRAMSIIRRYGPDAEVFKDVYEGACKHCIRLYLTGDIHSEPKLFKVSVLIANGNNIGVKVADLKPVIGATHPYCRCTLNFKPGYSTWSVAQRQFVLTSNRDQFSPAIRNRKSKVKVTIT